MNVYFFQNQELGAMSTMDKVKKILSSPITRKKNVPNPNRYFGVPLEDVIKRENHTDQVPFIVKKICAYILNNGN